MERSEKVDDCGCKLARDETGLHMISCPLHKAASDLLEACKDVCKFYQDYFDIMPVAFQTIDHILNQAIDKATKEGEE